MHNIVYFEKNIVDVTTKALSIYINAIKNGMITNPIIFCDSYHQSIDHIPIFHTNYIDQLFNKNIILTDIKNYKYIEYKKNVIVLYDKKDNQLLNDTRYYTYDNFIQELTNEKI